VGVNVPIRTVLFTRLCKFDGEKTAILTVREFQQIAGRAGRRGFDDRGFVAVQAPEHVIENLRLEQKAGDDPVKKKRIVRKKPPDKGYVHWDRSIFDRLVGGQAEALVSRFRVSHGMVLNVLEREDKGGCRELARLIHRAHERRAQRRIFGREAAAMFESLKEAGVIAVDPDTARVRVHVDLQEDFSIHHALSLWLLDALPQLDRESPTYALDVLTLVESILENPEYVLRQQLDALKTEKLAELKMAGVEYEERMAELEKLEHPKPLREFVYGTFNEFARLHPWVRGDDVRPKSVAREMVERFMDFNEYVREYELGRAEGTLLRYLSDVYKAVVQTVPAPAKTPELEEVEVFLRAMVRAVDSSLLDEWERMRAPGELAARGAAVVAEEVPGEVDVTQDERGFTVLVRNALYQVLRAVARRDWSLAASLMQDCKAETLEHAFAPFYAEHTSVRLDPKARSPQATRIEKASSVWQVVQVVSDAEGDDDWALRCTIDLAASARAARPVITFQEAGTT
jgi:superfamily II RNA helicase